MAPFHLLKWLEARRESVDAFLTQRFADAWPPSFVEPLQYPISTGGKRLRPALAIAAHEATALDPNDLTPVIPVAAALELVHTYSLVHDDLPCMDDDDLRRGQPTVHKRWDEATAVLVGDALLTEAFAVLCEAPVPDITRTAMVRRLARAAGYRGMVGGQAADIGVGADVDSLGSLTRLHAAKTGALFAASAVMGGMAGGATPGVLDRLKQYGRAVGLAFQLADDLLDEDEDAGADGPPSYVKLVGASQTRVRARAYVADAIEAIGALRRPTALIALARFAVDRDH